MIPVPQQPHNGTRDGARAAWEHIANQLQHANQENTQTGNRYRRELETL